MAEFDERLANLQALYDDGLITQAEFQERRKAMIDSYLAPSESPQVAKAVRQIETSSSGEPQPTGTLAAGGEDASAGRRFLAPGVTWTAAIGLWVAGGLQGVLAVVVGRHWMKWIEYQDRPASWRLRDLFEAEERLADWSSVLAIPVVIAGILAMVWFFQAYRSAESTGLAGRSWGPGWTIGAWFIPIANLIIPKLVMNEVDRMSNASSLVNKGKWRETKRLLWNDVWWTLVMLSLVAPLVLVALVLLAEFEPRDDGYGVGLWLETMVVVARAGALISGGVVVKVIGDRLHDRRLKNAGAGAEPQQAS